MPAQALLNPLLAPAPVSKIVLFNFSRPADVTAYAAGDSVCNSTTAPVPMTFTNVPRISGGGGRIVGATLAKSTAAAVGDSFDLIIGDTTFAVPNDNAVFSLSYASAITLFNTIQFNVATDLGPNNRLYVAQFAPIPFVCVTTSLFATLIARGAYVPGSAEQFTVRLLIDQD